MRPERSSKVGEGGGEGVAAASSVGARVTRVKHSLAQVLSERYSTRAQSTWFTRMIQSEILITLGSQLVHVHKIEQKAQREA